MARRTFFGRSEGDRPLVDESASRRRIVRDDAAPVQRDYVEDSGYVDEPVARDSVVEHRSSATHAMSLRRTLDGLLGLAILALEVLLAVRFALIAFGANRSSSFVNFIFDVSAPVVRPFRDTFSARTWDQGILDYNILLAMGVWFIAGIAIMMLINAIVPDTSDDYSVDRSRRVTHN